MTAVLLVAVVAAVGLVGVALGWWLGRSRRSAEDASPRGADDDGSFSVADVLEQHPTGIVIADATGRIGYRNAAARALTGTHSGVLIDEAIERHLALGREGAAPDRTIEFYGPPRVVFDVSARPLPNGGSVAFVEDISERKRVDQTRTDFVANVSHELKTPVGALSVLAETLVGETDPDTIARVVARMLVETDRAGNTIEDLIELSRIEAGAERSVEPVRVDAVIRDSVDRASDLAARCGVTITALTPVETADALVVRGDRRQLVSALGNLIVNAVKFSDPGSSVQVRARRVGDSIEVVVSDQGVGIPHRDLDRIFERFYRVDRARSRATGGTGLGLAIVRHVAGNHGGEVTVTSVEGEGSTFVLRLPLGIDNPPPAAGATDKGVA